MTDNTKTNNTKTREAHDAYVANRKEAGRVIDIETCEIAMFYCNYFDPYGTYPFDDDPLMICRTMQGRWFEMLVCSQRRKWWLDR